MLNRLYTGAILLSFLSFFSGCTNTDVGAISVTPNTQSITAGQTAQFTAMGIIGHGSHPATSEDVTAKVSWSSSATDIATINASGMATGVSAGTATITASLPGAGIATATVTVTGGGGGSDPSSDVVSLQVIPNVQSVASPQQTTQFVAIGKTTTGATRDVTNQVTWTSSSPNVATISATGLATGVAQGSSTIVALVTNPDKTVATGTATFTIAAGASEPVTQLAVTPDAETLSPTQSGQLIAVATSGSTGLAQDVTNSSHLQWISSVSAVATVTSGKTTGNGTVTGGSPGTAVITAIWTNPDGTAVSAKPVTVTVTPTTASGDLLTLNIVPTSIAVGNLQGTGQFLAIGTFSDGITTRDVTNRVKWLTSAPNVFPVNTNNSEPNSGASAGVVTAYGNGTAVIIAEYPNPDVSPNQAIQTATATFSCPLVLPNPPTTAGSCYPGSEASALLSTLTVYNEGLDQQYWLVTAPSATDPAGSQTTTPVIHCGPGFKGAGYDSSVCVSTYPIGSQVTLTAPVKAGQPAFGGWSSNCKTGSTTVGDTTYYTCTVTLTYNDTVGVIFN